MRKFLLGTTAVVGAALIAPAAMAQAPAPAPAPGIAAANSLSVRLGGFFDFSAWRIEDNVDSAVFANTNDGFLPDRRRRERNDFRSDAEVTVFVNGRAANGLQYGAVIEFQIDNFQGAAGSKNGGVDTDEVYGFVSYPGLGTLRFGDEDNAASLLQVRPPFVINLGPSSQWDDVTAPAPFVGGAYLAADIGDGGDNTKIIYLSPQFFGFDFGVSYAVNAYEGERTFETQRDGRTRRNEIAGAIRYRGSFGGVGLAASFAARRADAPSLTADQTHVDRYGPGGQQDLTNYSAGATITAYGFAIGGEYTWGRYSGSTNGTTPTGLGNSDHWIVGATYTIGAFQIGGYYSEATQPNRTIDDREQTVYGIGASYTIAPGLQAYLGYTGIRDENIPGNAARTVAVDFGNGNNERKIDLYQAGIRLAF